MSRFNVLRQAWTRIACSPAMNGDVSHDSTRQHQGNPGGKKVTLIMATPINQRNIVRAVIFGVICILIALLLYSHSKPERLLGTFKGRKPLNYPLNNHWSKTKGESASAVPLQDTDNNDNISKRPRDTVYSPNQGKADLTIKTTNTDNAPPSKRTEVDIRDSRGEANDRQNTQGVTNKIEQSPNDGYQKQINQQRVLQKQNSQGTNDVTLVGKNWEKDGAKRMPDLVEVNLDDPSLPRRQPVGETPFKRLLPGLVPSIVHFVWCRRRWFEFKPYLSIQSAIRFIKPDKIVFHYEHEPEQDKLFYHQWIDDLQHDFPFFVMKRMSMYERRICYGTRDAQMSIIVDMLRYEGGIYIGESTWVLEFPASNLDVDLEVSLEPNGIDGYVIMRPGISLIQNQSLESLATSMSRTASHRVKFKQCANANQVFNGLKNPHCLIVKGGPFEQFFPSDVWELKNSFGKITRRIFYGTEEILQPKPSFETLVPNKGHMIWLGGGDMDFVFYLSTLSMLYVLKVDTVYIHGDLPPGGPYWQKLMNNDKVRPRLKFITRPQPLMIYQGVIQDYFKALMSDIIRVDIMVKYGGIYADTDAIWVKPLSEQDRGYDAVASYDWVDWSWPYPDSVNFGLSYGKKNAPFWRIFRESMRKLHNDVHGFTGVMMPYKLLEKFPHLLRIDRHLQVICYQYRCHPTWVNNYHNMSLDHVTTDSLKNWRQDVNALHWTHPNPPELGNETALAAGKGMFADLGRMVLSRAGLWN